MDHTVDGRNLVNRWYGKYPIIYRVLAPSQVVSRISSINSNKPKICKQSTLKQWFAPGSALMGFIRMAFFWHIKIWDKFVIIRKIKPYSYNDPNMEYTCIYMMYIYTYMYVYICIRFCAIHTSSPCISCQCLTKNKYILYIYIFSIQSCIYINIYT